MPLRCIAIDDEPPALALIREYVSKFPALQLVQTFDDAISGAEYLRQQPVDLLFIDINMPDITGLDLVRSLQERPLIIFTTAYKKFAHEGFELDAVDYLLKPISFERFSRAVQKAIEFHEYKSKPRYEQEESLFIYSEYRMMKVNLQDIEYIESLEDYIKIHRVQEKPILTLMTLKGVLEKLPSHKFKRIHRSYIVSVDKVKSILNRKVSLNSGTELPVSDSYVSFINEWKQQS
ncbi:LytTR family DNA-binding domain-containing protein [Paraflavitalea sp. CAU 1676]|uniref:LytR/AlgR family response regulator transcription factor n=1 Tax=Paraflavitalea sp. CAU 1676 TaxID=3032598 RepID=UPI0023D9FEEB|nr:LytTR family DNA-binding domain-containing protein [Paraflavitalea sp. CAU 1676]MDF2189588.1 LytTR family DNA-binding domain-containing protein [Paraflavitalea sp. CAU 1676]